MHSCCEYTDMFPFSPLLFIVSITFLISFRSYYLNHAIQKLQIYSYVFPIKNAFYLTIGTLGTCSEPTEPCSDILGNFLLRQVASKVQRLDQRLPFKSLFNITIRIRIFVEYQNSIVKDPTKLISFSQYFTIASQRTRSPSITYS